MRIPPIAYRKAHMALKEKFLVRVGGLEARAGAGLTQQQLARRMRTTQAVEPVAAATLHRFEPAREGIGAKVRGSHHSGV
jgi:hypothetical protein